MSMLFNIFPDSEEDYDTEDGKSQIRVLEGIKMKMNLCNRRALVNLSRVIFDIAGGQRGAWIMNIWPYANCVVSEWKKTKTNVFA